ncbi:hypothetical protein F0L68_08400 [Solihabitans fulvus]|uniref:Uncharacterized protein n=1 Tax=Solihabitans fulvus TaxID=1892852 RepID=A0A5B2XLK7_9PSEU|nr:hypothetical protein [Solihabitans fulvus]KAA2264005.1 hypothetical protein F0L68_08400 [Solihabitans fulvus]
MINTVNAADVNVVDQPRAGRIAALAATLGLMVAMVALLLGAAALPAMADTTAPTTTTPGQVADGTVKAVHSSNGDIVVGGLAAIVMLSIAGAVLWHTARTRHNH